MTLEAECRAVLEGKPLQRAIEERAMRRLHIGGERGLIDREAMILTRDEDPARFQILHRVVGAMVAEFHLHRLRAGGEPEDLVTQADAEYRQIRFQELARGCDRVIAGLRIA